MKHNRRLHISLSVAVLVILGGAGARCFGQEPERGTSFGSGLKDHFTVVSADGSSVSPAVDSLLETIRSEVSDAMTSCGLTLGSTSEPLVWRYFGHRDAYRRYASSVDHASPAFVDAYYSTRNNYVVLYCEALPTVWSTAEPHNSGQSSVRLAATNSARTDNQSLSTERIVVLTHEMTHQLAYNSGLQKRGVMYPLWVSEGLATHFERCALSDVQRRSYAGRAHQLAELGATGRLIPLSQLAVMTGQDSLASSSSDAYAQYWGLMSFLLERHPEALNAYLADFAQRPMGRRAPASLRKDFVTYFGRIDALETQWWQFVASLAQTKSVGAPALRESDTAGL